MKRVQKNHILKYYAFFAFELNSYDSVAIFASGSGTNAENIINYFQSSDSIKVTIVYCNKKTAGVFDRCKRLEVPCIWFSKEAFRDSSRVLHHLQLHADFIVLAGFLWKIPIDFILAFPQKIVNIHPALLPKYGGKGMYGMHVHRRKENKETETGITIHFVNKNYDERSYYLSVNNKCRF